MTDKDEIRDQVQTLRDAAARYDWRQCEVSMFSLFTRLPVDDGMRIAIRQLADHLPAFERTHPDIQWVRQDAQGAGDRLLILDGNGNQIPFRPGTTWIQLTRPGANVQIN